MTNKRMNIYFCHSKDFNFQKELYVPVRESNLGEKHTIVFPHESNEMVNSKERIKESDAVFAEVSRSATGMGIELGWADMMGKRIVCFHSKGARVSGSLKFICREFVEYTNAKDLVEKIEENAGV